jgi:hypothetical protein
MNKKKIAAFLMKLKMKTMMSTKMMTSKEPQTPHRPITKE